jgi:hypothetical protein
VPRAYLDVAAAFRRAAATRPAATPSGAVVRPEVPAVVPPVVPPAEVLPLLEKVQIEGAEVLPEVLQTLEQIDVSLGSLDLASVSLEPTPSAVPSISDAMTEASASVTTTIDDL